jgi:hypothetical protein
MGLIKTIVELLLAEVQRYPDLRQALQLAQQNIESDNDFETVWPAIKPLIIFPVSRIREVALSQIAKIFAHEVIRQVKVDVGLLWMTFRPCPSNRIHVEFTLHNLRFEI